MKKIWISGSLSFLVAISLVACGAVDESTEAPEQEAPQQEALKNTNFHVFVIAMENHDAAQIYGNTTAAPYINKTLMANYAWGSNFVDTLPALWSEPHYVVMEGGKNNFSDHTFSTDDDPSASNSTSSTDHLVTQLKNNGLSWMSYQEGMTAGKCPIASSGNYGAKHNPFIFFKDVSGSPPSATNPYCIAHHKPHSQLAADLSSGSIANYVFITPNLCHDMHDKCSAPSAVAGGDAWLSTAVPPIINYLNSHNGVLFIVWDEGELSTRMPFLAIGKTVKKGQNTVMYSHASLVKSTERIFGLPVNAAAVNSNDFRALFTDDPLGVATTGDECPADASKTQPGICGCGHADRSDKSGYTDAKGYGCTDWLDYDCKRAQEDHGYTAAQEANLLASCSLSCGVCL